MPPARSFFLRCAVVADRAARLFVVGLALSASGCFFSDEGFSPPAEGFYFPTGLVISPGARALYVTNSDFDLQYNGGTVQALDLGALEGTAGGASQVPRAGSLRDRLNKVLTGVRCSQGEADACAVYGSMPADVRSVCNAIPASDPSAKANGESCAAAGDCQSGVCNGDSLKCAPCCTDPSHCLLPQIACGDGATCINQVCVLEANTNQILSPSACTPIEPPFQRFATIGAFASGAVVSRDPSNGAERLFVPVRGDPSITWFTVDSSNPGQLDCAQSGPDARCSDEHRMGVDPYDNFRDLTLPVEPVGLDASDDGKWLVSAHQLATTPAVGLSMNDWASNLRPTFEYFQTAGVANGPTEVAHVPVPAMVTDPNAPPLVYQPGFLVTYNAATQLDLFRVNDDAQSSPPRPFLTRAQTAGVSVNADGKDSRGIAVDASERRACEASCNNLSAGAAGCQGMADTQSCLRCCVDTPLRLFIANRSPPSLLLGRVRTQVADTAGAPTGIFDTVEIYDTVALTLGPSKVAVGTVIGPDGTLQSRVFAVTFDTRRIFSYDPVASRIDVSILAGRGPHAIAFDVCSPADCGAGAYAYLYVGHFTDSYLGVIDLDMRHPETFGTMFASIGAPLAPRESK